MATELVLPENHALTAVDLGAIVAAGHTCVSDHLDRLHGGMQIEGLLLNSRMVHGIFDDLNPKTRSLWDYPEGPWNAERNTREFVAAIRERREPTASVAQVLPCYRTLRELELQLHGAR